VDRQSFKQEDNIYCLEKVQINKLNLYLQFKLNYDEKVQINKLNLYLQFKLNYDVCYTYCDMLSLW
jgi:hypothetical protein